MSSAVAVFDNSSTSYKVLPDVLQTIKNTIINDTDQQYRYVNRQKEYDILNPHAVSFRKFYTNYMVTCV